MLELVGELANVVGDVVLVRVCLALGVELVDGLGSNFEILKREKGTNSQPISTDLSTDLSGRNPGQVGVYPLDIGYKYLVRGEIALIFLGALGLLLTLSGRGLLGLLLALLVALLLALLEFGLGNHLARYLIEMELLDGSSRVGDGIGRRRRRRV